MGNTYINVTVRGPGLEDLIAGLKAAECQAYLTPTVDGVTTLVTDQCDLMHGGAFMEIAKQLSAALDCPAWAVLNQDDDVLMYWLFDRGALDHEYESFPGYGASGEDYLAGEIDRRPKGGDARALCRALGRAGDVEAVEAALRQTDAATDSFIVAHVRHQALLDALGLPGYAVGLGWDYLEARDYPPGMIESDITRL